MLSTVDNQGINFFNQTTGQQYPVSHAILQQQQQQQQEIQQQQVKCGFI